MSGTEKPCAIAVTGDIAIDWLHETTEVRGSPPFSWQMIPGSRWSAVLGGASLLARMIEAYIRQDPDFNPRIYKPWWNDGVARDLGNLRGIAPDQVLRSYARIEEFDRINGVRDAGTTRRVRRYGGYEGPTSQNDGVEFPIDDGTGLKAGTWTEVFSNSSHVTLMIDDAGSEFRNAKAVPEALAAVLQAGNRPIFVVKLSRPIGTSRLWNNLLALKSGWADRSIVVLTGDALRGEGFDISRRLSWDRTLADVEECFRDKKNKVLRALDGCRHVVILLGADAAIVRTKVPNGRDHEMTLVFDPLRAEGDFAQICREHMPGATTTFVATLAVKVSLLQGREVHGEVVSAAKEGLQRARLLMLHGFVERPAAKPFVLDFPVEEIFEVPLGSDWNKGLARKFNIRPDHLRQDYLNFDEFTMPRLSRRTSAGFSILAWGLDADGTDRTNDWAVEIVRSGYLPNVPCANIGLLRTFDHTEAESYRAISNVMAQYRRRVFGVDIRRREIPRPISFAIFGPSGAGKSLGVSQIAEEIFGRSAVRLTFNLAQFNSAAELAPAFHRIRDIYLRGDLPFVLFDEFDSSLGDELGWLRHFLAPMQDGEFLEQGHIHPIGAAIFVFAGGTRESLAMFESYPSDKPLPSSEAYSEKFRARKGPDFVSRLRGHVDLKGINEASTESYVDRL